MILRVALATIIGSALIILLAILALNATPPASHQNMRVSVSLAHDILPVFLTLEPEKDSACSDAC